MTLRHLVNGSSRDSGFTSQDTLYTQPISEHQVRLLETSCLLAFHIFLLSVALNRISIHFLKYVFVMFLKLNYIVIGIKCVFSN